MESPKYTPPISEIAPFTLSDYKTNPAISTFSEYMDTLDSNQLEVLGQYILVTNAHNRLWQEIYKRTQTKSWKSDPNGIGSCNVSDELSLSGVPNTPFRQNLIEIRNRVNNQTPQNGKNGGCPNHRPNIGCVIGVLKGPLCLDYEDLFMKPEIEKRFGICLMPIKPYLDRISRGGSSRLGNSINPDLNREYALQAANSINNLTEFIMSFPVSHEV